MANTIRKCFALIASIVLLSTIVFASVNDMTWVAFPDDTATIARGDSVSFDVAVASFEPGAAYSLGLYDSDDILITALRSGVIDDSGLYSERIALTPADYGNVSGTFYLNIQSSEGTGLQYRRDVDELNLIVTQSAPIVSDIPDFTMEEGTAYTIDLNNYVADADDLISSMVWTVTGNTDLSVSIDAGNIATITAPLGSTGTETLTFTATDPSGASDSDSSTVTVSEHTDPIPDDEDEKHNIAISDITLSETEFYPGESISIKVRISNNGNVDEEDLKLKVSISELGISESSTFDLDEDEDVWKSLTLEIPEDAKAGEYAMKITVGRDTAYEVITILSTSSATKDTKTSVAVVSSGSSRESSNTPMIVAFLILSLMLAGLLYVLYWR